MIDYFKIQLTNFEPDLLLSNEELNFCSSVNRITGEIINVNKKGKPCIPHQTAEYKNLTFKIYDTGSIYLSGSLHKYFNNGLHNYNDFSLKDIYNTIKDLENRFKIDLKNCILRGLEIGLNIIPPIDSNQIITNSFLHKTKPLEWKFNSDEGKYKQCEHSQYWIKLYNKALHYSKQGYEINNEILRFEIKFCKMEKLNKIGIFTLHDLMQKGFITHKKELLNQWDNILYFDESINANTLQLKDFKNPDYWSRLIENDKKERFKKHRQQLRELNQNSTGNTHQLIRTLLNDKYDELCQNTQIDTLCIRSNKVDRMCLITGFNISMQKEQSRLLSHTGIKHYKEHHYKMYQQLEHKYLPKRWMNESIETRIKEIAHTIRNRFYCKRVDPLQLAITF